MAVDDKLSHNYYNMNRYLLTLKSTLLLHMIILFASI